MNHRSDHARDLIPHSVRCEVALERASRVGGPACSNRITNRRTAREGRASRAVACPLEQGATERPDCPLRTLQNISQLAVRDRDRPPFSRPNRGRRCESLGWEIWTARQPDALRSRDSSEGGTEPRWHGLHCEAASRDIWSPDIYAIRVTGCSRGRGPGTPACRGTGSSRALPLPSWQQARALAMEAAVRLCRPGSVCLRQGDRQ